VLRKIILAARGPAQGQLHRSPCPLRVRWIFGAFIKGHDDVGPEANLNLHRLFGAKKMSGAVKVRTKRHAFFADLAQLIQAEDLKAARVRENGPIP